MPGGWQTPMPMRVGGGGGKLIADLYATLKAGGGSLLNGEPGTETDVENMVIARMAAVGWRIAQAGALQADPRKLSAERRLVTFPDGHTEEISPLEREERMHEIVPRVSDTLTQRRYRVYLHERLNGRADRGTLYQHLADVFGSWAVVWNEYTSANADVSNCAWPFGADTAAYPGATNAAAWYNEVVRFALQVTVPPGTTPEELARRKATFIEIFDLALPAAIDWDVQLL